MNAGCYGCFGCNGGAYVSIWGCQGPYYYPPVFTAYTAAPGYYTGYYTGTAVAAVTPQQPQYARPALVDTGVASVAKPAPAPAQVTVRLPANAKLYVDDTACPLTSDTRSFDTPKLQPGQKYYYDVRAEFVSSGSTVSQTQRVVLEAGQQVSVSFPQLTTPVAAAQR